ncbi:protein SPMIP1 [Ascaphus truei]|uniref:protein SPMIP1 n=1 Tax=Ascaphus truei TaxID=8439 RepID=UPI003F5A5160
MARQVNFTTQKQEFLKQIYLKEILTRINWHRRYDQASSSHTQPKPKTKDQLKLPTITDTSLLVPEKQRKTETIKEIVSRLQDTAEGAEGQAAVTKHTEMRPASPKTRTLLYYGTSKEEEGRYRYLKERNCLKPEDKYFYPITSSWAYGWQIGNMADVQPHIFRRCCIVNDTFFRKNGIPFQGNPRDVAL